MSGSPGFLHSLCWYHPGYRESESHPALLRGASRWHQKSRLSTQPPPAPQEREGRRHGFFPPTMFGWSRLNIFKNIAIQLDHSLSGLLVWEKAMEGFFGGAWGERGCVFRNFQVKGFCSTQARTFKESVGNSSHLAQVPRSPVSIATFIPPFRVYLHLSFELCS